ncbi:MAG: SDR family NAD(P)-dependent oxidoreductase [Corallococcus sp.]|nr:SDR family NAD(P)-dependent oxidoreductase [Corallococcus sp.]
MKQKIAVITGASSGIGLECAKLFILRGYKVHGIDKTPYTGDGFTSYVTDICDYDAVERIFADVYSKEGGIDVLVNNAGFGIAGAMEEASAESIRKIVDVNLTALCVICSKVTKYMVGSSKIINISSVGGIMPLPYQAMYSATKAGVEVFSRALANELKSRKIKVCAVLPGDTKTNFTDARICEGTNTRAQNSIAKMSADEQHGKSPLTVAKAVYRAAKRKNPPLRICVGFASKAEVFLARLLPVRLINYILFKMYG